MIRFKFPKTTPLGYVYLAAMFPGSWAVADVGSDQEDQLTKFLFIILWFAVLMAGYTGWSKETEKYRKKNG